MSKALGKRCVWGLCGVLAAVLMSASALRAEVTTDVSGTIVVYPKVIADGTRDTVIQLTNTSNNTVHAWCFYINAAPSNPNFPVGPTNPRLWQVTDFRVWLSKQQPTHWSASQGRFVNPNDPFGSDGAGLDPGSIPPVPPGFEGELKCVQITTSGEPLAGNALKGEAVLRNIGGDVSKYNAVSILANGDISNDNVIRLDNTPASNDGEANSCAATIYLNHFADGVQNPVVESINAAQCANDSCPIRTTLTMVPCGQDLENVIPGRVTVQFLVTNEFENTFSASTTVDCWFNEALADIGAATGTCSQNATVTCRNDDGCAPANGTCVKNTPFSQSVLGTTAAFTRITPVSGGGVIGMAEEMHRNLAQTRARAAFDLQAEGEYQNGVWTTQTIYDATESQPEGPVVDTITIPEVF